MPSPTRTKPRPVNTSTPRRWADLDAAAAYFHCSTKTVRRMISRGEITGYRVGSRMVRVDLNELDDLARPIPAGDAA